MKKDVLKMKKVKQVLAILLVMALMAMSFVGCDSNGNGTTTNNYNELYTPYNHTTEPTEELTTEPETTPLPIGYDYKMTEYRSTSENIEGYKIESVVKLGDCMIRGYETSKLNAVWQSIGGKITMFDFNDNSRKWENSRLTASTYDLGFIFGTVSFNNLTSEEFPLSGSSNLTIGLDIWSCKWRHDGSAWGFDPGYTTCNGFIQYSNKMGAWTHPDSGILTRDIRPATDTDWKRWGPVPFIIGLGSDTTFNLFSPKFPDGNPELIDQLLIGMQFGDTQYHKILGWDVAIDEVQEARPTSS